MPDAPYAGVRVLVTGAAGFIGRWVARHLTNQGADLHLAVLETAPAEPVLVRWGARGTLIAADLTDDAALRALIERVRPAIVFNLAGYGVNPAERDEALAQAVNTRLPEVLAEAMAMVQLPAWAGCRIVHVGSALEYGTAAGDLREDTTPTPTTLYGTTKLRGTETLLAAADRHRLPAVVARLFTVYGPGEIARRLLPTLLAAREHDLPIPLTAGGQLRDFTYVDEVAAGLLRLGAVPATPAVPVNVATGRLTSVRDFTTTAARVLGLPVGRLRFGELPTRPEEMHHDPVNVERLRALTGWQPSMDVAAGVAATQAFA